jgi:hypothetical protein
MSKQKMKALSLWQPWASLIACGAKRYETRSWYTKYTGPVLICSARRRVTDLSYVVGLPEFRDALGISKVSELLFGYALALVEVVRCIPATTMTPELIGSDKPFGDFTPGRWAWELKLVGRFKEPFPFIGKQGLFDVAIDASRLTFDAPNAQIKHNEVRTNGNTQDYKPS